MSRLIASILLSILLFPLASLLYLVVYFVFVETQRSYYGMRDELGLLIAGTVTWAFIAAYWFLLWRNAVRWTPSRTGWTLLAGLGAAAAGAVIGAITAGLESEFGVFVGTASAPLLWLVASIYLWRESPAERSERVNVSGGQGVVCAVCGYNMTGLKSTRCPECGKEYTLDELLAAQPGRAMAELERT